MSDAIRQSIVEIARGEVGPQAKGSPQVREYWALASKGLNPSQIDYAAKHQEWCGIFALSCLKRAGAAADVFWKVGGGFVLESKLPQIKAPDLPKPGDICVKPVPFWHHSIVVRLENGILSTVDGNQPDVRAYTRPLPKGLQFYSVEPLLSGAATPITLPSPAAPSLPALRLGDKGAYVTRLQVRLGTVRVDGSFGAATEAALVKFQKDHALKPDAVCGPKTWAALEQAGAV